MPHSPLPLLLVMLDMAGIVTGRRLLSWWRGMVLGITVFAAFATPSVDPLSMLTLAAPIWALYFLAVGISIVNDRRRARRNPDHGLLDEEASQLDLSVQPVTVVEAIEPSATPAASELPTGVGYVQRVDDIISAGPGRRPR
ncbi:twin-arginine translocase subunit TatC [Kitasatospora sp. NPDC058406]|uniref:twin-arginine translocase subunit TatC n=1 Tax=Kitasatospora sp. NPDC058406 TaxID=3346483 RepID=UPI0036544E36